MEKDAEGFYTPASDSKAEAPPEPEDSEYPDPLCRPGWLAANPGTGSC